MTATSRPVLRDAATVYQDHSSGLRSLVPIGPALPGLTAEGLGYIRSDLLGRAATAEAQMEEAFTAGNIGLVQRCDATARTCREVAAQIVRYSMEPTWGVTE